MPPASRWRSKPLAFGLVPLHRGGHITSTIRLHLLHVHPRLSTASCPLSDSVSGVQTFLKVQEIQGFRHPLGPVERRRGPHSLILTQEGANLVLHLSKLDTGSEREVMVAPCENIIPQ